jgi:hypothetical protein
LLKPTPTNKNGGFSAALVLPDFWEVLPVPSLGQHEDAKQR